MTNYYDPTANTNLSQLAFNCDPSQIADRVLLIPFLGLETFRSCFDHIEHEFHSEGFYSGLTGRQGEIGLTIIRTGIGSIRVIDAILALRSCNIKRMGFAGTCGGLASDLKLGSVLVPTGTHIIRDIERVLEQQFANPEPLLLLPHGPAALAEYLASSGQSVATGVVASIPSIFLLQDKLAQFLQDADTSGIDLECAYLHQVCQHLGLVPELLLTVSDLPIGQPLHSISPTQKRAVRDAHIGHVKQFIHFLLQARD